MNFDDVDHYRSYACERGRHVVKGGDAVRWAEYDTDDEGFAEVDYLAACPECPDGTSFLLDPADAGSFTEKVWAATAYRRVMKGTCIIDHCHFEGEWHSAKGLTAARPVAVNDLRPTVLAVPVRMETIALPGVEPFRFGFCGLCGTAYLE